MPRVVARAPGADAAGLAFDALTEARAKGMDVLLVDTAGRLQNKAVLMDELEKIVRVMKKVDPLAPHPCCLCSMRPWGRTHSPKSRCSRKWRE